MQAGVAQLVERRVCKPRVRGSSPFASSRRELVTLGLDERISAGRNRPPASGRHAAGAILEGCPSGSREQTVNLPAYGLRRFESFPLHHAPRGKQKDRGHLVSQQELAGIAQLVEHQPSKLRVAGSSPVSRSNIRAMCPGQNEPSCEAAKSVRAHVAQSVEHFLGKEEVTGSNPVMGSRPEGV